MIVEKYLYSRGIPTFKMSKNVFPNKNLMSNYMTSIISLFGRLLISSFLPQPIFIFLFWEVKSLSTFFEISPFSHYFCNKQKKNFKCLLYFI